MAKTPALIKSLQENTLVRIIEIVLVFAIVLLIIAVAQPFTEGNPLRYQAVVWTANVVMLAYVWLGLRLRGQGWSHLGLRLNRFNQRTLLLSVPVFIAAVAGFVIGAVIAANIAGVPEGINTGGYEFLRGNLPVLIGCLVAVYVVSSLGEEIIYRGFLITRIAELGGSGKAAVNGAVILSAVIFGLVHFSWGITGMIQTGCMGLALGIAYLVLKRDLNVLVLAHAYLDTILLVQLYAG